MGCSSHNRSLWPQRKNKLRSGIPSQGVHRTATQLHHSPTVPHCQQRRPQHPNRGTGTKWVKDRTEESAKLASLTKVPKHSFWGAVSSLQPRARSYRVRTGHRPRATSPEADASQGGMSTLALVMCARSQPKWMQPEPSRGSPPPCPSSASAQLPSPVTVSHPIKPA